jgi:NitT/TauT family transport system ATP-binding protein
MMTRSPGRIREIIDIDLPRPRRRTELLLEPRYQKYVVNIERMFDDGGEDGLPR